LHFLTRELLVQVYSAEQTTAIKNVVHELTNQLIISPFGNYLIQGWQIKKNYLKKIIFIGTVPGTVQYLNLL
jgi:hypothetical protein